MPLYFAGSVVVIASKCIRGRLRAVAQANIHTAVLIPQRLKFMAERAKRQSRRVLVFDRFAAAQLKQGGIAANGRDVDRPCTLGDKPQQVRRTPHNR